MTETRVEAAAPWGEGEGGAVHRFWAGGMACEHTEDALQAAGNVADFHIVLRVALTSKAMSGPFPLRVSRDHCDRTLQLKGQMIGHCRYKGKV